MSETATPFGTLRPNGFERQLIAWGRRLPPNPRGRRMASLLRSIFKRIRRQPLDLEVLGQNMRLWPGDNAGEKRLIVTPQFFDPGELAFLKARLHPQFVFVDIGCNVGAYSIFVARNVGAGARILAVDPNATVLERLAFNAGANGITNLRLVEAAISDTGGEMEFAVDSANLGGSSLQLSRRARGAKHLRRVQVRTLAELVAEAGFDRIDAIKVDVEGVEDRVLMPYLANAPRHVWPRAIVTEWNPESWSGALAADLLARGYRDVALAGTGNRIHVRDDD